MEADKSPSSQGQEPTVRLPFKRPGWAVDALVGSGLLFLALVILLPRYGRHYEYHGARFHGYFKTLYTRSALWNIKNDSPFSFRTNREPYTHHPPLLIVFLQVGYFFDRDFSHAESVPIAFSLATCLVLFVSVRLLWSRRIAITTVLAFILSPAFVLFGTFVNFEPPCLFFIVLGWSLYVGWWNTGQKWLLAATLAALFAGCMADWTAYFLIGPLGAHALWTAREDRLQVAFLLASVGVLSFALFLLISVYAQTGSLGGGHLWESFVNRIGVSPIVAPMVGPLDPNFVIHYTLVAWLGRIGYHIVELNTVPVTLATLTWLAGYTFSRGPRPGWGPEGWILILLAPAVLNNVVFNGLVWQHPFFQYYFLPGFALASALVLDRLGRVLPNKILYFSLVLLFYGALAFQTGFILWRLLP